MFCIINLYGHKILMQNCNCLWITVVEDNSSAPERTEDQLDHETGERIAKSEVTRQQVCQLSCAMAKKILFTIVVHFV